MQASQGKNALAGVVSCGGNPHLPNCGKPHFSWRPSRALAAAMCWVRNGLTSVFLDGARSECNWGDSAGLRARASLPAANSRMRCVVISCRTPGGERAKPHTGCHLRCQWARQLPAAADFASHRPGLRTTPERPGWAFCPETLGVLSVQRGRDCCRSEAHPTGVSSADKSLRRVLCGQRFSQVQPAGLWSPMALPLFHRLACAVMRRWRRVSPGALQNPVRLPGQR